MPFDDLPPHWLPGQKINAKDLNALGQILQTLQRYFGDNFTQNYTLDPNWGLAGQVGIVRPDGGSPGLPTSDLPNPGVQCYLDLASPNPITDGQPFQAVPDPLTSLYPYGSTVIIASNLANVVAAPGVSGGPMPAVGQEVLVFKLASRGNFDPFYQTGIPNTLLNLFWWQPSNIVASTLDASGAMDPSGTYYSAVKDNGLATGMPPEGQTSGAADTVLLNAAEQGLVNGAGATYANSHWLPTAEQFTNAYPAQIVGSDGDFTPSRPMAFTCVPNPFATFVVKLTPYSMSGDGNATTPPSYQYVCEDLWGNTLSAQATPTSRPYPGNGSFTVASWGLAHYDQNGDFQLLVAFEIPNTATCP